MNILVTGGAGYIGSHTLVELLKYDHTAVVVDNLVNGSVEALKRVEKITNTKIPFYEIDLADREKLNMVFDKHSIDAVIHFAGLKAVGESVQNPLLYYSNNIDSTLSLLEVMEKHKVLKLVFSSSATVYGNAPVPYAEDSTTGIGITSSYGESKYMIEQILKSVYKSNSQVAYTILRYFNPVGAHESGHIGEDPVGPPNNLMPYIAQVSTGKREKLSIFGNDYDTPDGTCIRDYIHISDLAKGHVAAMEHSKPGCSTYNLGSGVGTSVLQLVNAFISTTGQDIPYVIEKRRAGDLSEFYADPMKAWRELGWKTEKTIEDMCRDTWRWQSKNPSGYNKHLT